MVCEEEDTVVEGSREEEEVGEVKVERREWPSSRRGRVKRRSCRKSKSARVRCRMGLSMKGLEKRANPNESQDALRPIALVQPVSELRSERLVRVCRTEEI